MVWSISHFHSYLYGHTVTVFTDHSAVRAVLENPNPSGKHARWWTRVYGSGVWSFKIMYRPGKSNSNADALSRSPQVPTPEVGLGEVEVQVAVVGSGDGGCGSTIRELLQAEPQVVDTESLPTEQ